MKEDIENHKPDGEIIPQVTAEVKEDVPEMDEYEQSAQMFHILKSQFRKMGYALANRKKRAPIRVLEKVLFSPHEDIQLCGKEEEELVDIANQIMYHKNKITEYFLKQKLEKEKSNEQK